MTPCKRPDIEQKRIGNELYLYLPDGQSLAVLNTTSMLIWSLCDGRHTLEEMVEVLQDIFGEAGKEMLPRDIQTCLANFRKGLLTQDAESETTR